MNLLLIAASELEQSQRLDGDVRRLVLDDWRARHICEVLHASPGDRLKVGIINGHMGLATLNNVSSSPPSVEISIDLQDLNTPPPPALNARIFSALPRPKAARRMLRLCAELGVKDIHFVHCYKVEKSYWHSPELHNDKVAHQFHLGLSQAVDTVMPVLHQHRLFKPFVEDQLEPLVGNEPLLVAEPSATMALAQALKNSAQQRANIVIGPEGGFIPYEIDKLVAAGAEKISLGARIYRSEVALAQLMADLRTTENIG